ncbi:hypothetical protein YSA_03209 [Pseudomonas putida ND6]|jgi:hypothetical protein|uniref:Uncharacterized protein n=1 Tax=Pseudomonas putida ND6 TaxID=231023 RepID=I3USN9_PSEPU|nr:hypothetical protein YSA_03209 [Pseudomonas putida ND6]
MGVVPPASAGLAYLLSLFFFRIDVKSKSMGARRSNPPIWISSSHDPPAQKNSGFASL